jgi:hypothetical protein
MKEELERKKRVINMMITMHSVLSHQNRRKALCGNIVLLLAAIFLNVFIFFDYKYLAFTNLSEDFIKNLLGIASIVTFALSIIFLLVDWNKMAEEHEQSINQLSKLLSMLREIQTIEDPSALEVKSSLFNELYDLIMESLPKIPNNKFNRLKAKHYYKVELSKFIDKNKGIIYPILRCKFFYESLRSKNGK